MEISKRWFFTSSLISVSQSFEVVFQPDGKRGRFHRSTTILQAASRLGVDINMICGGSGSCGKCIIKIVRGVESLSNPTKNEIELIGNDKVTEDYRLACLTQLTNDTVILVPKESRTGTQRLQTEGLNTPVKLEPYISTQKVNDAIQILLGDKVIRVLKANEAPIYGFAVDIGSTKLAGYLMDLSSGDILAVSNSMNPQIPYGEDIITRITYALKGKKEEENLHQSLVEGIRQLLQDACAKIEKDPYNVYEVVIVGNTAMQHFFLGLDPKPLSYSPFTPKNLEHRDLESINFKLGYPKGNTHVLPLIAGFVGADCVAAILATGIHKSEELCFLIDIGTNTEIVVGNRDGMVTCSCASGPAFEGAHIKHGMRASSGAIESAWIDQDTFEPRIKTIDEEDPIGICGSGLVDLLSEMLKAGIIDSSGRIISEIQHPRIRKNEDIYEYVVAWKKSSRLEEDIVVSQRDVRELQKGKAAIYSGAELAMKHLGLSPNKIEKIYMAGAFGTYINRESSLNIGLLPDFNMLNIEQVGNAAGTGSRMTLLSRSVREEAKTIQRKVEYIELAANPDYNKSYMDALLFPHRDLEKFPETIKKLNSTKWVLSQTHKRLRK